MFEIYFTKNNSGNGKGQYIDTVNNYEDIKNYFDENIESLYIISKKDALEMIFHKDDFISK